MRINRGTIAAGVAAGALALAVPALAQDDADSTPQQESTESTTDRHAEKHQRFAEALAAELDLPVEEVSAALETVRDQMRAEHEAARLEMLRDRLAAAVERDDLTQEQADAILEAAEQGVFPDRMGRKGPRGPHGPHGPRGPQGPGFTPPADADADADTTSA